VTSRVTYPRVDFKSSLFLLVVVTPVALAANYLLLDQRVLPKLQTAAVSAIAIYLIVYAAVGLHALCGRAQVPAVATLLLLGAGVTALDSTVAPYATLWMQRRPDNAETTATRWDKAEELLISQPARISSAVSRIVPAVGKPGIYFVGFAGVGRQRVFAEEIKLAASRVADRYGSSGRSILLLNDQRDVSSYPLATVSGLTLALKGVASRMNLDQDVLFLALSSHGSATPSLTVSNGHLPLRDLTGTELAAALQESAIKWRVIIICACHAGAFIDALRNDNTIVLTAAAADRTSFGCSDDRDLTYFGEAFYRDALPRSTSLREAFERAQGNIAARELREGITPSLPQGFFGPALDKKLAAWN
jgi:hypothetical protein